MDATRVVYFIAGKCMKKDDTCNKTVFQRCCGDLLCDLQTFGKGKCVKCLPKGHFCGKDVECCSRRCNRLKCAAN
ncbi:unnamed protein product [Dibothriocephalus latus]|uniref:UPF0506 domain-containing protein n=1 Tax=Dibothriocephalus latus TaxID=60516 RepID=A0A3P7L4S9_DIBLA|nr:unnamed protein product [Dibothriocephalus latus]